MKRVLALIALILCASALLPSPAWADAGGWPTTTPTVTPTSTATYTPLAPTVVTSTPTPSTPYPPMGITGDTLITPPVFLPLVNAGGTPDPAAQKALPDQQISPSITPLGSTGGTLAGGIACWPVAIIALVVGLVLFAWLRSGIRKGA